jgi:hypothetical protein
VLAAVEDLSPGLFPDGGGFDKVSMFESLQYFRPETFGVLLERIADIVSPEHRLYFSGVLDLARIDRFLDTPERRRRFEEQAAQGQHEMGHWWTREAIARVAHQRGYHVEFRDQHPRLNTAHYRFDLLLVAS